MSIVLRALKVLMCMALLSAPSAVLAQKKELVIVTPGGEFEKALKDNFFDPFAKSTGTDIVLVSASSSNQWAKAKAMAQSGKIEWDLVSAIPPDLTKNRDLLTKLDCSQLPNIEKFGILGTCMEYGVLRNTGAGVMTWNAKTYPPGKEPKSWADFFDVARFPGKRALMDAGYEGWMMMTALVADGVARDKHFPLDVDRAIKKLEQLKPHVSVWWKTGDQSQNIMRSGEADMAILWSGRAISLKRTGTPVDYSWNQSVRDPGLWGVLKGAPHMELALQFVNFFMGNPEAHLAFSRQMVYGTSNRVASSMATEEEKKLWATTAENWNAQLVPDWMWLANNEEMLRKRFAEMLLR